MKKFDLNKLMDLCEVLRMNGFEEEAYELEDYIYDVEMKDYKLEKIMRNVIKYFREKKPEVFNIDKNEIEYIEDDVQTLNVKTRLANMLETYDENQEWFWFKDVVKYEECYFVYDNVLWRRVIRWNQFIWLSNIEKCKERWNTKEYIKRWKGVKEKIVWMPRVQDCTIRKWLWFMMKGYVDKEQFGFRKIIYATKMKWLPCPSLNEIKKDLENTQCWFEYWASIDEYNNQMN